MNNAVTDAVLPCDFRQREPSARQFSDALGLPVSQDVIATVPCLLRWGCPSAVPRLVVAIVVDAVDGHADRLAVHVGKEVLERAPSLAHADPAPSIGIVVAERAILAAASHRAPRLVRGRFAHAMRPTRPAVARGEATSPLRSLPSEAAAARCVAGCEVVGRNGDRYTAVTYALPVRSALPDDVTCHYQAPEPRSDRDSRTCRHGDHGGHWSFLSQPERTP